jgi:hypothetical protein
MTPGGGPLDFEARQRNTAVHRSIRFRSGRADRLELLVVDQPQQGPTAGESKSDEQNVVSVSSLRTKNGP